MEKKRSTFEVVLISVVVILSLILGVGIYAGRATVQKRRLLIQELSMLRSAISLYAVINKQLPPDLTELEKNKYTTENSTKPYLEYLYDDNADMLRDPFGNPYHYDPVSGWVRSTTEGYTRW